MKINIEVETIKEFKMVAFHLSNGEKIHWSDKDKFEILSNGNFEITQNRQITEIDITHIIAITKSKEEPIVAFK